MTNPKDDQSREEFEKWKPVNGYGSLSLDEIAFKAWQAARAQNSDAVRELIDILQIHHDLCIRFHNAEVFNYGEKLKARTELSLSRINGEPK